MKKEIINIILLYLKLMPSSVYSMKFVIYVSVKITLSQVFYKSRSVKSCVG